MVVFQNVDLRGVEPRIAPCHGAVLPLYYRPVIFVYSIINSKVRLYMQLSGALARNRTSIDTLGVCRSIH